MPRGSFPRPLFVALEIHPHSTQRIWPRLEAKHCQLGIQMAQAALGRTVLAAGGTLVVLGGATVVVSTVSMGVTKMIVDRSKVRLDVWLIRNAPWSDAADVRMLQA